MHAFSNKFMMYYEIKRMRREGSSFSKISEVLDLNRRTVTKYSQMDESEFERFLQERSIRQKTLSPYEDFVHQRLSIYQDTSAAQMHDWLKERFEDFPTVDPKTVFNFVRWVRSKYSLPVESRGRDFQSIEDTAYGLQAQVDFGEYNLRNSTGKYTKIHFFTYVLSRSRFKFIWFLPTRFTSETAILAHELAFAYCGGVPQEIVYDQDKVFIHKENHGDVLLTSRFKTYIQDSPFKPHFCRKSDPQSKGKVENLVKYVKQNFLYNRTFHDIDTLNQEAEKWLERTANKLPHGFTKKLPVEELCIELPFLSPHHPISIAQPVLKYSVRKDNTISWKSNLYSVPLGTYKGRGSQVGVRVEENTLILSDEENNELCTHIISTGKGLKIINTHHKRDLHVGLDELINSLVALVDPADKLLKLISRIKQDKPRYIRDQLLLLKEVIQENRIQEIHKALDFSVLHNVCSAGSFNDIVSKIQKEELKTTSSTLELNPLSGTCPPLALMNPQRSQISDYQNLFNFELN